MVILIFFKRIVSLVGLMVLIAFPSFTFAEWVLYASSDESGADLYYSPESISSTNGYKIVETLSNYRETKIDKYEGGQMVYKSEINKQYIDCWADRYANISWDMYPKLNAQGKVDHVSSGARKWKSIIRHSVEGVLLKKVCGEFRI